MKIIPQKSIELEQQDYGDINLANFNGVLKKSAVRPTRN